MSGVGTIRRYLLGKERQALIEDREEIALAFRGKRNETSGTALPTTFPALTELAAAIPAYTTVEDLTNSTHDRMATVDELVEAGLTRKLATAVIAAITEL
jgi:hypothetical protein